MPTDKPIILVNGTTQVTLSVFYGQETVIPAKESIAIWGQPDNIIVSYSINTVRAGYFSKKMKWHPAPNSTYTVVLMAGCYVLLNNKPNSTWVTAVIAQNLFKSAVAPNPTPPLPLCVAPLLVPPEEAAD